MFNSNNDRLIKILRILLSVLVICVSILFLTELYYLKILTGQMFMIAAVVIIVIDAAVVWALNYFTYKQSAQIFCSVLAVVLAVVYGTGSWYISRANTTLSRLTSANDQIKNVINVYAMKDSPIENINGMNNTTLGVLNNINKSGTQKLIDDLKTKGLDIKTESYDNFEPLVDALYDGSVDEIAVNEIYQTNITDIEKYAKFSSETKIVYQFVYYTSIKTIDNSVSSVTEEPFTIMFNGSDSRGGLGDTDRSDVNMLVTINPETHVVLMTSIPRDAYVETACDPEYECQNGALDKLTHTGIHTYNTTKKTLENLFDIDINYVFRANFTAVVDLVDALGGIDVYVQPGYAVDYFYTNDLFGTDYGVVEGVNHLNGEAALCYSRERYAYAEGDFQRIKNQQEVLTAIAKKVTSPEVITRYNSLLNAIDGNFWTDLSQDEIMSFIQLQISENPDWSFLSYSITGTPSSEYCAESYGYASVVIVDQNSVKTAHDLIEAVIDGESASQITEMVEQAGGTAPNYAVKQGAGKNSDSESDSAATDLQSYSQDYQEEPVYEDAGYDEQVYDVNVYDQNTYEPNGGYEEPVYTEPVYTEPVLNNNQSQTSTQTPAVTPSAPIVQAPGTPQNDAPVSFETGTSDTQSDQSNASAPAAENAAGADSGIGDQTPDVNASDSKVNVESQEGNNSSSAPVNEGTAEPDDFSMLSQGPSAEISQSNNMADTPVDSTLSNAPALQSDSSKETE